MVEKKVLVAVDDSTHSRRMLGYAARLRGLVPGLGFTLFHSQPAVSQFLLDEARLNGPARAELARVTARNVEAARALLDRCRELLVRAGVPEPAVECVTEPRKQGLAKDIIDQAQHGLYDAVLVGRRGLGSVQQMVMGSVSAHVTEHSHLIPVWLVDGEVPSLRVMAAVDGSAGALRAVDHLAFMLSGNAEALVRFFHVKPKLRDFCAVDFGASEAGPLEALVEAGDRRCMDDFHCRAGQAEGRRAHRTAGRNPHDVHPDRCGRRHPRDRACRGLRDDRHGPPRGEPVFFRGQRQLFRRSQPRGRGPLARAVARPAARPHSPAQRGNA